MHRRTILLFAFALAALSQEPNSPAPDAPLEFVSGTISDLPAGKIVVNRAVLGKPAENRTFVLTSETKIEGTLRVTARVTVGFKPTEAGEAVAVRIIVRPPQKGKASSSPSVSPPSLP
jgi:hypothetical protein